MPLDNAKNGARATLASGITAGATSVTLTAGHGARLPSVPFNAWIYNATDYASDPFDDPNYEIVRATARSNDTLIITRGQESTSAAAHNTGGKSYRLVAGLTARTINYEVAPQWYNAKAYGLAGDGVTDDTVALQALIDRLTAAGGGKIYFPPGVYLIGGALQETSGRNAQILLPSIAQSAEVIMLEFEGAITPPTAFFQGTINKPTGNVYSIIKSTLTGGTGTASMMAGKVLSGMWNNVQVNIRNMIFESPANPSFTMLNLSNEIGNLIQQILIHPGNVDLGNLTEPTNSNAIALRLPANNHSAITRLDTLTVFGYYAGLELGELSYVDVANLWGCSRALLIPFTHHPSQIGQLGVYWCPYGIVYTGGSSGYLTVRVMDIEHANIGLGLGDPWQANVADIYDPSNLLRGDLKWIAILGGVGNHHTFVKTGGTNLITTEFGA